LSRTLEAWIIGVLAVAALYFAREVFVPLALALLLSFALGPLVLKLRKWHFGRATSVFAAVAIAFFLLFAIATVVGGQLAQFARDLPLYSYNMTQKIESLRGATLGGAIFTRLSAMTEQIRKEIATPAQESTGTGAQPETTAVGSSQQKQPIPVEISRTSSTPWEVIQAVVGPLLQPLATTGIVVVFVVFFLLQREELRNRFIRLAGAADLSRTTRALDDAAHRLSRYLLIQSAINSSFGLVIGLALWLIGVPNPILWGILAMLLRFVPYIGPVIAAAFPAAVTFAVDPGWTMLIWTIGVFLVLEPVTGQVVEPLVYGKGVGLSSVALIVAAAFWTWLWGPIGLLLSTPLTLCLVVLGRHVESLEFLSIALSDRPALSPEEIFYQRMLAGDPDEAARQAEEFLKLEPLSAYYDRVAVKGLALAQLDINRGTLDPRRRMLIRESVDVILDDLSEHADGPPVDRLEGAKTASVAFQEGASQAGVLCIAGRGPLDEAVAAMLVQLLGKHAIGAQVISAGAASAANILRLENTGAKVVCLSFLEAGGLTGARFMVRRLRRRFSQVRIIVGFWTLSDEDIASRNALQETEADLVVNSLRQAVGAITAGAQSPSAASEKGVAIQALPPASSA
jgi:predicted PurR-regulated permease PerM